MTTKEHQAEPPWKYPLQKIREIQAKGLREIIATGESNVIEEITEFERQWIHTQLPNVLVSWSKMTADAKRQYIDTLEGFAGQLKAETGAPPGQCGAGAMAQLIDMLGNMTPECRKYASEAKTRIMSCEWDS